MACLATRVHVHCRRESKFAKPREKEKRDALSGRYWSENLVIVPLPECQAGDVYQQAVRALNTHLHTRSA